MLMSLSSPDRTRSWSGKMLSRRSSFIVAITTIAVLVLLYTARIGVWPGLDEAYYRHRPHDTHQSHQAPPWDPGSDEIGGRPPRPPPPPPLSPSPPAPPASHPPVHAACEGFPDTSNVLLVMKTGASEAFARVPTQLMTMLHCLPDYLIFSDMEQNIGGQQIHDSLATVLSEAQEGNSDFDLYRRQKACLVDQENCNKQGDPSKEGWSLDKYKNIHMAEKAYAMRPGYDWYLFVDADSYVLWSNMVQWLGRLDPTEKLYLGSETLINGFSFAHGGSGYVISKAAMQALAGEHAGVANEYDVRAKNECCGDYLFAVALKNKTEVGVKNTWPTINGEKPSTLPFGPSHWCQPIVTMHHMNSEEINTFWHFERRRQLALAESSNLPPSHQPPLLLRDIYAAFLAPHLNATRDDWDNDAERTFYLPPPSSPNDKKEWPDWQVERTKKPEDMNALERKAHESFAACGAACKSLAGEECFRYRYRDGVCSTGNAFVMGRPVKKEEGAKRVMSGWDVEKIHAWVEGREACGKVNWPAVKKGR